MSQMEERVVLELNLSPCNVASEEKVEGGGCSEATGALTPEQRETWSQ